MPFVKLDCAMLDSTVYIDRDVRDVFITALLMAGPLDVASPLEGLNVHDLNPSGFVVPPGFYGLVEASGPGIVRRAGLDPVAGMKALETLCSPEPESRSPEWEGRRMTRVNGGYIVLNYGKYRERDYGAAERMRVLRLRRKSDGVTANGDGVRPNTPRTVTQAEAEAEAEGDKNKNATSVARPAVLDLIRAAYPKREGAQDWPTAEKRIRALIADGTPPADLLNAAERYRKFAVATDIVGTKFVQQASTFFGAKAGWREPWEAKPKPIFGGGIR